MTSFVAKEQLPEHKDLTNQAVPIVFYDEAPEQHAYDFLVWREKITDPAHALNKSPLLTLMVLDTWLACDVKNPNTPEGKHWTRQLLDACGLWAWPLNSSATELYYRLGHMLTRQDQLNIAGAPLENDARLSQLLAWCEILEDQVRPEVSASIAYQLQENGVVLCEPQGVILDAVATRMLHQRATFPNMNMLWASAKVRTHAKYAIALAQCAPDSLPVAIERCLLRRGHAESSTDLSAHACVFDMDPSKSNATQLLNALILSYTLATAANATPRAHAVWGAVSHAWPSYTSLLHTVLMMHGVESLLPDNAMRTTLIEYVEALQKGQIPMALTVENMFECS